MSNRTVLFVLTLIAGAVLSVLGVALSAPIGAPDGPGISDPRLDFAPMLFVLGVTLMFGSAVVYELAGGDD
jgi:hypothetical protein